MKSIRLAACATHPIQYHAPIWRRLAADPGLEFEAFFGTDMSIRGYTDREFSTKVTWDTPLTAGYSHCFLSTDSRTQSVGPWAPTAKGLRRQFQRFRPDVVLLTAYGGRFHLGALRTARAAGARVIMRHEASDEANTRSSIRSVVRKLFLRWLYARIDGFAVIGTEARRHLLGLGVPDSKMNSAPYCVDSDFFAGEMMRWALQRTAIRGKLGINADDIVLIFSGKLIPKKDPLLIFAALALLESADRARLHLLVAGDGELRSAMEQAGPKVLGTRSHLLGFLNQTEIGRAYAAADVLALPSRRGAGETWGLVVNEGMQFGLPAIVSDGVGCHPDLIVDGKTGFVFGSGDAAGLADAIRKYLALSVFEKSTMRESAIGRVKGVSLEVATRGIIQSIHSSLSL